MRHPFKKVDENFNLSNPQSVRNGGRKLFRCLLPQSVAGETFMSLPPPPAREVVPIHSFREAFFKGPRPLVPRSVPAYPSHITKNIIYKRRLYDIIKDKIVIWDIIIRREITIGQAKSTGGISWQNGIKSSGGGERTTFTVILAVLCRWSSSHCDARSSTGWLWLSLSAGFGAGSAAFISGIGVLVSHCCSALYCFRGDLCAVRSGRERRRQYCSHCPTASARGAT